MDPHKRSATIEVIDEAGRVLEVGRFGIHKDGKAAGKTSMEAMRYLRRRLSNVVYRQIVDDQKRRQAAGPGGHSGTTLQSSVTDLTPDIGSSDKPHPGPAKHHRKPILLATP